MKAILSDILLASILYIGAVFFSATIVKTIELVHELWESHGRERQPLYKLRTPTKLFHVRRMPRDNYSLFHAVAQQVAWDMPPIIAANALNYLSTMSMRVNIGHYTEYLQAGMWRQGERYSDRLSDIGAMQTFLGEIRAGVVAAGLECLKPLANEFMVNFFVFNEHGHLRPVYCNRMPLRMSCWLLQTRGADQQGNESIFFDSIEAINILIR